jgi:hypothetical protein
MHDLEKKYDDLSICPKFGVTCMLAAAGAGGGRRATLRSAPHPWAVSFGRRLSAQPLSHGEFLIANTQYLP